MTAMVDEGILNRIRKCLKLADKTRGATEAEAETAMAMARKLMDEHNLSMSDVEVKQEMDSGVQEVKAHEKAKAYVPAWEKKMARVVDMLFNTRHYYNNERSGGWTGKAVTIVFMGVGQDPHVAKESFLILGGIVRKMGTKKDFSGSDHRDYCLGVVDELLNRAFKIREASQSEIKASDCRDLMVVKDQLIKTYMGGIGLTKSRVAQAGRYSQHYEQGRADGKKVNLEMRKALK